MQVTGALLVDEEQRPMNYSQTFQLLPDGQGSYFVFNDIFRLVYNVSTAKPAIHRRIRNGRASESRTDMPRTIGLMDDQKLG